MKKAVFKFHAVCGRMGQLDGVLISTQEKVDKLIESKIVVYFGDVLGKHSEIRGEIERKDITMITDNEEVVRIVEKYELTSGFNPFEYTAIDFEMDGCDVDMEVGEIIDKLLERES